MPGNRSKAESHATALRGACVLSRGRSDRRASAQFLIMGGSDDSGNGLAYSQRLSGVAPGKTPVWTVENMNGYPRFEGCAVLLPDGTVFLTSGAQYGAALRIKHVVDVILTFFLLPMSPSSRRCSCKHRVLYMHHARRRYQCADGLAAPRGLRRY